MAQGKAISSVYPSDDGSSSGLLLNSVDCDSSVYIGAVVRLDSSGKAFNALADDPATSNFIGVCEDKGTTVLCNIRVLGTTTEVFTGLDVEKVYYLSDVVPGGMTIVPPSTTGHVTIQVGQPFSLKRLVVLKGSLLVRG